MGVSAEINVYGVREALKELGEIDKKQRFKAINKVKAASQPMVNAAREKYPSDPVLTNEAGRTTWKANGRLGYSKATADKGVQVQVGGRSRGEAYAIVTLIQKNPGASMFDIAGFANGAFAKGPQGEALIAKLNRDYGKAQRGMWRNIAVIRRIGDTAIMDALKEVTAEVNRKLVA
jgi:hypothetical protein